MIKSIIFLLKLTPMPLAGEGEGKVFYFVMPDLIRHPEGIENTGFRLKDFGNDKQKM